MFGDSLYGSSLHKAPIMGYCTCGGPLHTHWFSRFDKELICGDCGEVYKRVPNTNWARDDVAQEMFIQIVHALKLDGIKSPKVAIVTKLAELRMGMKFRWDITQIGQWGFNIIGDEVYEAGR